MNTTEIKYSFEEVKSQFESKSFFERGEFMNNYHFKDDYGEYYVDFILKNAQKIKSNSYLSDLVCFTIDHNIFDERIIKLWFQILQIHSNSIVVLSTLDYFNSCPLTKLPFNYKNELLNKIATSKRKIIKNQVYINLLSIDEEDYLVKIDFFKSLKNTKDYRSILRVISCLFLINSIELINEIKAKINEIALGFIDKKIGKYIISELK